MSADFWHRIASPNSALVYRCEPIERLGHVHYNEILSDGHGETVPFPSTNAHPPWAVASSAVPNHHEHLEFRASSMRHTSVEQ